MGDGREPLVRVLLAIVWIGGTVALLARLPVHTPGELAAATGLLVLATSLLLTTAFYAHYLVPVVALALSPPEPPIYCCGFSSDSPKAKSLFG